MPHVKAPGRPPATAIYFLFRITVIPPQEVGLLLLYGRSVGGQSYEGLCDPGDRSICTVQCHYTLTFKPNTCGWVGPELRTPNDWWIDCSAGRLWLPLASTPPYLPSRLLNLVVGMLVGIGIWKNPATIHLLIQNSPPASIFLTGIFFYFNFKIQISKV